MVRMNFLNITELLVQYWLTVTQLVFFFLTSFKQKLSVGLCSFDILLSLHPCTNFSTRILIGVVNI